MSTIQNDPKPRFLFVGGKHDGERYHVRNPGRPTSLCHVTGYRVTSEVYTLRRMRFPADPPDNDRWTAEHTREPETLEFYALSTMSDYQVLALLIKGYRLKPKPIIRKCASCMKELPKKLIPESFCPYCEEARLTKSQDAP